MMFTLIYQLINKSKSTAEVQVCHFTESKLTMKLHDLFGRNDSFILVKFILCSAATAGTAASAAPLDASECESDLQTVA